MRTLQCSALKQLNKMSSVYLTVPIVSLTKSRDRERRFYRGRRASVEENGRKTVSRRISSHAIPRFAGSRLPRTTSPPIKQIEFTSIHRSLSFHLFVRNFVFLTDRNQRSSVPHALTFTLATTLFVFTKILVRLTKLLRMSISSTPLNE